MAYTIQFERRAQKDLHSLSRRDQTRMLRAIDALANDPRPPGVKKYRSEQRDIYRIRVGKYRAVYVIEDDQLVVMVIRVGHRSSVYRRR